MDSQFPQDFQIYDPYSIFQVPQQEEEPMDLDRSMENLIQSENDFFESVNRLEAQMGHWSTQLMIEMGKVFLSNFLSFPISLAILIGTKNYGILETLTKILFHHNILNMTNPKPWTNWQVFIKKNCENHLEGGE